MLPLTLLLALSAPADGALAGRVRPLVEGHKGRAAVGVKHLLTGEGYFHNADEAMPTASLIKVAVLVEAYLQADEGRIGLRDPVTLRAADARTDAGILYTPGGPVAVCVLTADNADRRWASDNAGNLLCARVARAAYDHFNDPARAAPAKPKAGSTP